MNEFSELDLDSVSNPITEQGQVIANTFQAKYKAYETHAVAVGAEQATDDMIKNCGIPVEYRPVIKAYFEATNKALELHQAISCSMAYEKPQEAINILNRLEK